MKKLLFNNLRVLFAVAGFMLLYNYGRAQIVNPSWASNTSSASIGDTSSTNYSSLVLTVNLTGLDETESFSLLLTDDNDNTVINAGEYIMKKHENGFYYVEEKSSHNRITVLDNAIYFSTAVKKDKVSKIKTVSMNVRSKGKDRSGSGNEKTVKTKVPKFKKK